MNSETMEMLLMVMAEVVLVQLKLIRNGSAMVEQVHRLIIMKYVEMALTLMTTQIQDIANPYVVMGWELAPKFEILEVCQTLLEWRDEQRFWLDLFVLEVIYLELTIEVHDQTVLQLIMTKAHERLSRLRIQWEYMGIHMPL